MFKLLSLSSFLSEYWMIFVLLVAAVALFVPSFLRQKKEMTARAELSESIKKGVKIITTAGVYGVVEAIEETTDGKVVTIITGNSKNPTTMSIHINAIMGIDNKTLVKEGNKEKNKATSTETTESEPVSEDIVLAEDSDKKKTKKKSN